MTRRFLIGLFLLPALAFGDLVNIVPPNQKIIRVLHARGGNSIVFVSSRLPISPNPSANPSSIATAADPAILRWKSGETLKGNIAGATATDLTWKTSLFQDPLRIEASALDRVDWAANPVKPAGPFAIALRDGSFIYGDVVSVAADSLTIQSARLGRAVLKRSEVLSARRLEHGALLYAGPLGNYGWLPMIDQPDGQLRQQPIQPGYPQFLAAGPGGALRITSWNRGALLEVSPPDKVDLAFRLHSSKRLEFALALGADARPALRLETWSDVLVLAAGDQFKIIRQLGDADRELALRLCWDRTGKHCTLYTAGGELITDWQVPADNLGPISGISLHNRGADLSLDFLRIKNWDGKPPVKFDASHPHLELSDGRDIEGAVAGGSAPGTIRNLQAGVDIPLSAIDALVFSSDPPHSPTGSGALVYNDGATIFGTIAGVTDGRAEIESTFAQGQLTSQLDNPLQLRFRSSAARFAVAPAPLPDDQDKIRFGGITLGGKLGTAADGTLGWIPPGGLSAARPAATLPSEIIRALPASLPPASDPALFYLSSGDVLPGTLGSVGRSGAEFKSSIMPARKISADELAAIEFRGASQPMVQSFSDPGWQIVKGTESSVRRSGNSLQMDAGTALYFPGLMQSSEINFKFSSSGFSSIRLRLFSAKSDTAPATSIVLGYIGNQFVIGTEAQPGQLDSQTQVRIDPGNPINVKIKIALNQVEVFVNDVSSQIISIDSAKRSGTGLLLEPAGLWGNTVNQVALTDFATRAGPGAGWLPDVTDDIKTQALTVPRAQKDDPPRHLLLAENGDVLRGEIMAATDVHFGFRCGLENLDVPRDRVRAVIFLKAPDPLAQPGVAVHPEPSFLHQRMPMRVNFGQVGLAQVIGFLMSQVPGAKIQVPENTTAQTSQFSMGNQTVGEAIALICTRFNLHSRIREDGVVVLESEDAQAAANLSLKAYWLKPDAMAKDAAVKSLLTAKGVTFPDGATVEWRPESGLLIMTNSADNQARLATLIASDLGGSQGSPNEWVELTGGAQLALAVDKVDRDFVFAHHPVYGAIQLPLNQVYALRSTPPEPDQVGRVLQDWRLVNAPEPVLPEGGGEVSPLLGKDAATFKLPLLDGGNFDLAEEKGHVVVLDFWASWCAPCVKSLPELLTSLADFPSDRVKLVGVNQGESAEQVKHFRTARNLNFPVAMDSDQSVAQKYGVDAIPHTVIIGPDGKVAWVQTGASDDGDASAADIVKKLLEAPGDKAPGNHL